MLTSPDATGSTIIALSCQENYLLARKLSAGKKQRKYKENNVYKAK